MNLTPPFNIKDLVIKMPDKKKLYSDEKFSLIISHDFYNFFFDLKTFPIIFIDDTHDENRYLGNLEKYSMFKNLELEKVTEQLTNEEWENIINDTNLYIEEMKSYCCVYREFKIIYIGENKELESDILSLTNEQVHEIKEKFLQGRTTMVIFPSNGKSYFINEKMLNEGMITLINKKRLTQEYKNELFVSYRNLDTTTILEY